MRTSLSGCGENSCALVIAQGLESSVSGLYWRTFGEAAGFQVSGQWCTAPFGFEMPSAALLSIVVHIQCPGWAAMLRLAAVVAAQGGLCQSIISQGPSFLRVLRCL
jgi:hypothetical protein